MNVYAATEGDYSEYHIVGVFSDKEKAGECIEILGDGRVEVFEVDEKVGKRLYRTFHMTIYMDSAVPYGPAGHEVWARERPRIVNIDYFPNAPSPQICVDSYVSQEYSSKVAVAAREEVLRREDQGLSWPEDTEYVDGEE
jgi:hypothetical protein